MTESTSKQMKGLSLESDKIQPMEVELNFCHNVREAFAKKKFNQRSVLGY